MNRTFLWIVVSVGLGACTKAPAPAQHRAAPQGSSSEPSPTPQPSHGSQAATAVPDGHATAIFAGGCFWCVEAAFEPLPGVESVVSGYTGGSETEPSYEDVSRHRTSHLEAIRIVYDPEVVTYAELLETFWHNIDPTQDDGQFCDRGNQYRSAIFVNDDDERSAAEASLAQVQTDLGETVVTRILLAGTFWVAEDYHQDYYRTNPVRYQRYREGCGRDRRLAEIWGSDAPAPH